jgi:hypothetical protein
LRAPVRSQKSWNFIRIDNLSEDQRRKKEEAGLEDVEPSKTEVLPLPYIWRGRAENVGAEGKRKEEGRGGSGTQNFIFGNFELE